jgi:hypothetical protein
MTDAVPNFIINAESQDVIDDAAEDLQEWWKSLGDEQRGDYLCAWDALQYGDHARAGCYELVCVGTYQALGFVRFLITIH